MNFTLKHAIQLMAALLCLVVICVAGLQYSHVHLTGKTILTFLSYFTVLGGAVTITYLYPTNLGPLGGGNVAPTQQQIGPPTARRFNSVVATISASAAGDTSAVITHNFQLTNSEISQGFPWPLIIFQADETSSPWFEASENPNFTVLQKNTLNAGAAAKVVVKSAHSLGDR